MDGQVRSKGRLLRTRRGQIKKDMSNRDHIISALQQENSDNVQKAKDLEGKLQEKDDELRQVKQARDQAESEVTGLKKGEQRWKKEVITLQQEQDMSNVIISDLKANIEAKDGEVEGADKDKDTAFCHANALMEEIETKEAENKTLRINQACKKTELSRRYQILRQRDGEIWILRGEKQAMQVENDVLENRINAVSVEIGRLKEDHDHLWGRCSNAERDLQNVTAENDRLVEEKSKAEAKVGRLFVEKDDLADEVRWLKSRTF
ncbi:hypothetical protein IAT40_005937 [Kwoniella sp. CBS 6097]